MRFMVLVKASPESEAGVLPTDEMLTAMGKYNEELVKAGVMLAGDGLQPTSKGARIRFEGKKRTVIDGPFAETKELLAGYWIWQVRSREEAIEWLKRAPFDGGTEIELRQIFELSDFEQGEGLEIHKALRDKLAPPAPAKKIQKIVPHLWYAKEAEEAARFYASIFPDSRVDRVTALQAETPSGPPGSVKVVEFTLFGQEFNAISAGPMDPFNHAISFVVNCVDQAEVDRYWNALLEGGSAEQCGWLKDRYGVSWQIVPTILGELMTDSDRNRVKRVTEAMLKMVKLDVAGLKAAYEGR